MRINLIDNNASQVNNVFHRKDIEPLFPIADLSIAELCRSNENLLVFPHSIDDADDRIGNATVINLQNTSDPNMVRIATGNVMGFIGVGNLQLKIRSRFDAGREDYFLQYMLQKVMSFNLFDLNHNNEQEEVFDFIMFMFPYCLKEAMRQGIYREYRRFEHNDTNTKGPINVSKHIAQNIPFVGNIAYHTREYSHDNSMTQLVRHTIEFMKTNKFGDAVLNIDRDTIDCVKAIVDHTPTYDRSQRMNVLSKNLRQKTHPYYTGYTALQNLCIQILRMEEVRFGESEDEICGILFDGAWLWEEYINTILKPHGFIHPENKLGKGKIYLFEDVDEHGKLHRSGVRYPDFYKEDIVLDAKYKRLEDYENVSKVERNDLNQVITYMDNLKVAKGGFIAPLTRKQTRIPTSTLKGKSSTLSIFGVEISKKVNSYQEFCEEMQLFETEFVEKLKK